MNKIIVGVLVVLALVLGYFVGSYTTSKTFGATGTRFPNGISANSTSPVAGEVRGTTLTATGSLTVGTNGSTIAELKGTTCNLIGTDASQVASTTVAYDCAVTGIASGDVVMAMLATSTPVGGSSGWSISAAKASTTAGYITVLLYNNGVAAVPSVTSVGSSTNIWYMDN